jgi:hypothetical protein
MLATCTANICSGITEKVHWKNCHFEKLQFFTVDLSSLYYLQVKNCDFSVIFHVVCSAMNWKLILQVFTVFKNATKKNCKNWAKKLQRNSNLQKWSSGDDLILLFKIAFWRLLLKITLQWNYSRNLGHI